MNCGPGWKMVEARGKNRERGGNSRADSTRTPYKIEDLDEGTQPRVGSEGS